MEVTVCESVWHRQ